MNSSGLEPAPDAFERGLRIGCGSVFGFFVAGLNGLIFGLAAGWLWGFILLSTVVCAYLALTHGDRFWTWVLKHIGFGV